MPTVETIVTIKAPISKVYEIAKDNRSFPEYMKDVKSLTVIEEDGPRVVSDYVGLIPQFMLKVRWRQEDIWDDAAYRCVFRQVQGDYDKMEGWWEFSEAEGVTTFRSFLDYEYNVPTLGPLIKKIIHGIVIKNMDNILDAIKQRSEA